MDTIHIPDFFLTDTKYLIMIFRFSKKKRAVRFQSFICSEERQEREIEERERERDCQYFPNNTTLSIFNTIFLRYNHCTQREKRDVERKTKKRRSPNEPNSLTQKLFKDEKIFIENDGRNSQKTEFKRTKKECIQSRSKKRKRG